MKSKVLIASVVGSICLLGANARAVDPTYVIHISIDGGKPSVIQSLINSNSLPNFKKFQTEGSWTNNARTDYDYSITLPNHTSQVTGRTVINQGGGIPYHNWTTNSDPAVGVTLASNRGEYVASVFDVAHDNGLKTAMFATKSKFSIYDTTYNGTNGANDITGANNGKDKIDTYIMNEATSSMMPQLISGANSLATQKYNYTFVHIADPDDAGHASGWGNTAYQNALITTDGYLGQIFTLVTTDPTFIGKTTIVLTADHGGGGSTGTGTSHDNASLAVNYTIPFYVWGVGTTPGADLYALNPTSRLDPLTGRPLYGATGQPIRNGDSANLELDLLGLGPVTGSYINFSQNLVVGPVPEPASLGILAIGGAALLMRRRR